MAADAVSFDCRFEYHWARGGAFTQWLLPERTVVEATVSLVVDPASGQVLRQEDVWHAPVVPALPRQLRRFNAAATNSVFRLLGWEKELEQAEKSV